ncbi:hypothetical protein M271_13965 [Streptomyces rapamycinicus NRRL 5491]|nr:hypothetical protein M271_13965 [Streptomyces rapamycinicus NRRL 5491]
MPIEAIDAALDRVPSLVVLWVEFRGTAAARAPKAVVVGFGGDTAGWLLLQFPLSLAPAACWWARQMVESMLRSQVMRPS